MNQNKKDNKVCINYKRFKTNSMHDACHKLNRGISVAQWLSTGSRKSEGLRFNSSWGLGIFTLSHAHGKTKK